MMVYDEMRSELNELFKLVQADQEYCAAAKYDPAVVTPELAAEHAARSVRISELKSRYGIH